MTKLIKKQGILFVQILLYGISFFVPKNKRIWIFGSWNGYTFSDNSKYLYLHLFKHHPEIRCIYICKDKRIIRQLNKKGMEAYDYYSVKGCLLAMRAGVAFLTAAHSDVNSFCCARIKYIQLFHGTPLKMIYKDDFYNIVQSKRWKEFLLKNIFLFRDGIGKKDFITVASPNVIESFETAFETNRSRILLTGLARTDAYRKPLRNTYITKLRNNIDGPLIAYLPTHRCYGNHTEEHVDIMADLMRINELLEERNLYMIYKPHYTEMKNKIKIEKKFTHIILPDDLVSMSDVYSFTPYCDLLITDYSSIYFDFLLADKPIVFFNYDFEHYLSTERKLYYDYDSVTPGPKCRTWEETIEAAARLLQKDDTAEFRRKICKFFNQYEDGGSCERIYQAVCSKLRIGELL